MAQNSLLVIRRKFIYFCLCESFYMLAYTIQSFSMCPVSRKNKTAYQALIMTDSNTRSRMWGHVTRQVYHLGRLAASYWTVFMFCLHLKQRWKKITLSGQVKVERTTKRLDGVEPTGWCFRISFFPRVRLKIFRQELSVFTGLEGYCDVIIGYWKIAQCISCNISAGKINRLLNR